MKGKLEKKKLRDEPGLQGVQLRFNFFIQLSAKPGEVRGTYKKSKRDYTPCNPGISLVYHS